MFTISITVNSKDNVYIRSASLNGKVHTKNYIRYSDLASGGLLQLGMSNEPAMHRGIDKEDRPFSLSRE